MRKDKINKSYDSEGKFENLNMILKTNRNKNSKENLCFSLKIENI